ncbi:hypothetical protein KPH14_012349 [Odynerus spinipes]|uniref:Uncharacterized protein n=1 Tax=Odynerus spinipes TaxID=1348599 RepID=A0AAD9RI02_9HYME|nr:hypothetical protein KPH14_012349 [Odynerus spinipes]
MDLRVFLLPVFFLFLVVNCESTNKTVTVATASSESTTINIPENASSNVTVSPLPSLCTVCICASNFVNCTDRGLNSTFEEVQWPKTPIAEISFKGNHLVHVTPFPAVVISNLILRQNHITIIDNCAFKKIVNLTSLDLSHNELRTEKLIPQVFEGRFSPESYEPLSKLTFLNLAHNKLHALNQDIFEHVPSLKVLTLTGNPLKMIEGHTTLAISSLPYLEELDLSYCELNELPKHIFHKPRYLKKLVLSGNQFTSIPNALANAKYLQSLTLDENPIESINRLNAFPAMPMLKVLNLYCMPYLSEVGRGSFAKLTALETLHLQNCPLLKEIDGNAFQEEEAVWPPLKGLYLSDNALRYLPSQLVARWDKLEELDLMNNQWSCDCDNQYLIGLLLPQYGKKLMGEEVNELKCIHPPEYAGVNLTSLANRQLRCLDLYGARPEKDGAILIGILIGLLLAVPLGLAIFVFWQRGFFFCGSQGPATYSRAFYKRTPNDDYM